MGTTVCRAVEADPDLALVAAVDPGHAGARLRSLAGPEVADLEVQAEAAAMDGARVEVAVDFTQAAAAMANLRWCAEAGVHAVVGTTGLGEAEVDELRRLFPGTGAGTGAGAEGSGGDDEPTTGTGTGTACLLAPNFAIGAVLLMRLAELAAPWFETAEVIELHHDAKADAPSGTAMLTVQRMAAASDSWGADPTTREVVAGARGGAAAGGIRVHSVRLRGLVAHHEVLFGTLGQSLSIRHDSYDRSCFMPGVVLAAKAIARHPGLTVGLDRLLGL